MISHVHGLSRQYFQYKLIQEQPNKTQHKIIQHIFRIILYRLINKKYIHTFLSIIILNSIIKLVSYQF